LRRVVEPIDQEDAEEVQVVAQPPLGYSEKAVFLASWTFSLLSLLCIIVAGFTPWFQPLFYAAVYCKDQYLWLFVISPMSLLVMLVGNYISLFRPNLLLKCWSISVVTMLVPSLIMFVCFSASLVNASGAFVWKVGAYFILTSHLSGMAAAISYLKFCTMYDIAMQRPLPALPPPPRPLSITIGEDLFNSKPVYSFSTFGGASK